MEFTIISSPLNNHCRHLSRYGLPAWSTEFGNSLVYQFRAPYRFTVDAIDLDFFF